MNKFDKKQAVSLMRDLALQSLSEVKEDLDKLPPDQEPEVDAMKAWYRAQNLWTAANNLEMFKTNREEKEEKERAKQRAKAALDEIENSKKKKS